MRFLSSKRVNGKHLISADEKVKLHISTSLHNTLIQSDLGNDTFSLLLINFPVTPHERKDIKLTIKP